MDLKNALFSTSLHLLEFAVILSLVALARYWFPEIWGSQLIDAVTAFVLLGLAKFSRAFAYSPIFDYVNGD